MERDERIGLYMIGARDGNAALPLPPIFHPDRFDVLFEADESAIAQIRGVSDPARSRVLPYCLADRNGPGTLFVNLDPYTTSLLPMAAPLDIGQVWEGADYPCSVAGHCEREVPVELRTLDSLHLLDDGSVAPPNMLLLDTQGSELQIMRGGAELIRDHTVAIETEAEFMKIYKDQPLFGDIANWLADLDFFFAGFSGVHHGHAYAMPLGQRGRSLAIASDALFFRNPESLTDNPLLLAKLAFIAISMGYAAIGFRSLDLLKDVDPGFASLPRQRTYVRLLLELSSARAAMPPFTMPTFIDLYPTYEESNARFDPAVTPAERARQLNVRKSTLQTRILSEIGTNAQLFLPADTPVEAVLRKFGLHGAAEEIRRDRLTTTEAILKSFGIHARVTPAPES
jgi:FkbM family methyltransferase